MKSKYSLILPFAISMGIFSSVALAGGDVAKGEKLFKRKCKTCHVIADGKKSGVGPNLFGFMNRPAGSLEGFKYSKNMAAADFSWNDETLNKWLKKPKAMIKGTRMSMKVGKAKDRANVVAYLMSVGK